MEAPTASSRKPSPHPPQSAAVATAGAHVQNFERRIYNVVHHYIYSLYRLSTHRNHPNVVTAVTASQAAYLFHAMVARTDDLFASELHYLAMACFLVAQKMKGPCITVAGLMMTLIKSMSLNQEDVEDFRVHIQAFEMIVFQFAARLGLTIHVPETYFKRIVFAMAFESPRAADHITRLSHLMTHSMLCVTTDVRTTATALVLMGLMTTSAVCDHQRLVSGKHVTCPTPSRRPRLVLLDGVSPLAVMRLIENFTKFVQRVVEWGVQEVQFTSDVHRSMVEHKCDMQGVASVVAYKIERQYRNKGWKKALEALEREYGAECDSCSNWPSPRLTEQQKYWRKSHTINLVAVPDEEPPSTPHSHEDTAKRRRVEDTNSMRAAGASNSATPPPLEEEDVDNFMRQFKGAMMGDADDGPQPEEALPHHTVMADMA